MTDGQAKRCRPVVADHLVHFRLWHAAYLLVPFSLRWLTGHHASSATSRITSALELGLGSEIGALPAAGSWQSLLWPPPPGHIWITAKDCPKDEVVKASPLFVQSPAHAAV